jgi:hypothetical protein
LTLSLLRLMPRALIRVPAFRCGILKWLYHLPAFLYVSCTNVCGRSIIPPGRARKRHLLCLMLFSVLTQSRLLTIIQRYVRTFVVCKPPSSNHTLSLKNNPSSCRVELKAVYQRPVCTKVDARPPSGFVSQRFRQTSCTDIESCAYIERRRVA